MPLQSVQNAAAWRRDLITPIIRQLHWLPVRQRVTKTAVLVFQCLTGQAPAYLTVSSARADSDQPTQRRASSDDQITVSATGVLRLLEHVCGTCCQSIYGCVTVLNSLNGRSRPICLTQFHGHTTSVGHYKTQSKLFKCLTKTQSRDEKIGATFSHEVASTTW